MILAGIDEAGYGPILGPLVVSRSAFELASARVDESGLEAMAQPGAELPDLWKPLKAAVSKSKSRTGKLHVADSKSVYTPSAGLTNLERGVLAFTAVAAGATLPLQNLDEVLQALCPGDGVYLAEHAWYRASDGEAFPISTTLADVSTAMPALRSAISSAGIGAFHIASTVLPEGKYNRMVEQTRNKAAVLLSVALGHLHALLHLPGDEPLVVVCDRQGGRTHYRPALMQAFPDFPLTIAHESEERAGYVLRTPKRVALVLFMEKSEDQSLPTALASMACKYLREALMHRFNAWWTGQMPPGSELVPTAGYYTDGVRFLKDIEAVRAGLKIPDHQLIRSR